MATAQANIIPYVEDTPTGGPLSPTRTSPNFSSYLEYIDALSQILPRTRCFDWLYAFLSNLPAYEAPNAGQPNTRVLVADATDAGWRMSKDITEQLLGDDAGVNLRIIVVECEYMAWIDRAIVDMVALFYDINPVYLWGVFSRNRVDLDYSLPILFPLTPVPFDSPDYDSVGLSALELIHTNQRQEDQFTFNLPSMSGIMVQDRIGGIPTVLIFSKERAKRGVESILAHHASKNIVSSQKSSQQHQLIPDLSWDIDVFEDLLCRSKKSWVEKAIKNPSEALFLYHSLVLHTFAQTVTFQRMFLVRSGEYPQAPEVAYLETNQFETSISLAYLETKRHAQTVGLLDAAEVIRTLAVFERMLTIMGKHKDHYEKHMQSQMATYSLAESRKSIEMSDSVKLLTQLAFIFIPLTFSATVFGINVQEFGTGELPISAFIVTAIIVTASSMLLWWFGGKILSKRFRRFLLFTLQFSLLSPRGAFVFLTFVIFGKHRTTNGKGLDGLSGLAWLELWVTEDFMFPSHRFFTPARFTNSEVWMRRLSPFADFVNTRDWKTNYAIKRWYHHILGR
ncbi:hypothetical protein S40293_10452 [Stachybotrys chartarum IBT 40293]|nr:hypothetical protein S40293_10452 [Stachybotrys chartarum IBT 40293]